MASNRNEPLAFFFNPSSLPYPIPFTDPDSFLIDVDDQIGSSYGSFQDNGYHGGLVAGGSNGSDVVFGFMQSEFRQSGSAEYYERHVFLSYKEPQLWPPKIEDSEFDRLPRLLFLAIAARRRDMKRQTRFTICEANDGTETSDGDVLIFPDMVRYRKLTHFDIDTFVEVVLVKDRDWLPGFPEPLRGTYVFVCAHGTRDMQCGVCGPAVISRFRDEIKSHSLQSEVSVRSCSHMGSHNYAGNVIIFGSSINGEVTGHWYGYVMPDDVRVLLEQHIEKGEVVDWLWRGQMGSSEDDQKKCQEPRGSSNMDRSTIIGSEQTNKNPILACGSHMERTSCCHCCQINGTFPCCQHPDSPKMLNLNETEFSVDRNKGTEKHVSRNYSGKRGGKCKVYSTPTWYERWEREDTYAVLAVIGAAVSVAVAYSCYKQLR